MLRLNAHTCFGFVRKAARGSVLSLAQYSSVLRLALVASHRDVTVTSRRRHRGHRTDYTASLYLDPNGRRILLAARIDDFVLVCADRPTLNIFRIRLLEAFSGTYEGPPSVYLGCKAERDVIAGTTILSQKHFTWTSSIPTAILLVS